ncbi:MAG: glycosyltransferase family 2 protein [Thermodesulfobacteriota bacterium]
MKKKIPLSVAIITKDEEENLPDCLRSVSFADDIVVVDSGSADGTARIAEEFGCRVFVEKWKGYGPQKQSAIAKTRHEWVLMIDADERVPMRTGRQIAEVVQDASRADAYSFPRKNILRGRWIRHSDWWPDRVVRLVKKDRGRLGELTHERWISDGPVVALNCPLLHYSYEGYADMFQRANDYSTLTAEELFAAGRRTAPFTPASRGAAMFLKIYLLKMGLLDGVSGMAIALSKAWGSYLKYAKLRELQRGHDHSGH